MDDLLVSYESHKSDHLVTDGPEVNELAWLAIHPHQSQYFTFISASSIDNITPRNFLPTPHGRCNRRRLTIPLA